MTEHRDVVFVGGTPFSGVEAAANLLADRQGATPVPLAAHFHSDPWGVPALLHGRIGLADFAERLRELEIAERISSERLDGALEKLRAGYHADPLQSCRELFWTLIGALVPDPGDGPLVEASPGNLAEGQTLMRLVPEARFVHVVRDGRDVAAAAIGSGAVGASRLVGAVEWWAGELRVIERGVRGEEDGTRYGVPQERLTVVVLDELEPPPTDPEPGAWRSQVHGPARWWASRRYDQTLGELEAEGNHAVPALRAAYERLG
ncbi:MAG: sulfotransferase [Solirubrobacterales bacterium]